VAVAAARKYPSVTIETGDHTPLREDEVVFTIRAQDDKAVPTIECYRELCIAGDSPPAHIAAINLSIAQVRAWQQAHPELVKSPD
jgi:hypothetical protein